MNDDTTNGSGNRWEPTDQPAEQAPAPYVPDFAVAEPVTRTPWLTRTRTAVAGGAAVLLVGGLGGFALSHATSGSGDDEEHFDRQGVPSGFDRNDDGPASQVPGRSGGDDGGENPNGSDSLDS